MSQKKYRLIPAQAPTKRGPKTALYAAILDDFLDSGRPSVRVEVPDKSPATIAQGLRRAIKTAGAAAKVTLAQDGAYLHR